MLDLWNRLASGQLVRESHETPDWAAKRLIEYGGLNRHNEPNFIVSWGWNNLALVGGLWEDRDASGNLVRETLAMRREPKYPHLKNFWTVEQWFPAEKFGSPEDWYRKTKEWGEEGNIPQLGPFPSRGRYGLLCVLMCGGKPIPLTETVLEDVIVARKTMRERRQTLGDLKELEAKKRKAEDDYAKEFIADGRPAFGYNDFVSVL